LYPTGQSGQAGLQGGSVQGGATCAAGQSREPDVAGLTSTLGQFGLTESKSKTSIYWFPSANYLYLNYGSGANSGMRSLVTYFFVIA